MAIQGSTLNGIRVTSSKVSIPSWGCWYADVSLDGEHTISGDASLVIADLTLVGTVLSGGPQLGRSTYRIVAGKGGWRQAVARKAYANDAGVKLSTVVTDAAADVGETVGTLSTDRLGPAYVRQATSASRVLQDIAPQGWYVDEAGVTQIGARAAGELVGSVTRIQPLDKARGKIVLAAESIATILPGVVVDGITAVDVLHEISAEGGLRSTIWGSQAPSNLDSLRTLVEQLDPNREYRGTTEYRVVTLSGNRLNLQPVRVSSGMPELERVPVRPGVAGCSTDALLGSKVLVSFIGGDPAYPYVAAFEDPDGDGFVPDLLTLKAGGMVGGEHIATVEGTALMIYNTLVVLMATAGGGPLVAAILQPLLGSAILTALTAQGAPAPPTEIAQIAASAAQLSGFATGLVPATTSQFFAPAIALLAAKTANDSGYFPSLGCKAVKAG